MIYDFSASTRPISIVKVSKKYGLFLQVLISVFSFCKVGNIFWQNIVTNQISISNYGLMNRAAQKTIVVIYRAMYTKHDEYTLTTEAIECIDNESLD